MNTNIPRLATAPREQLRAIRLLATDIDGTMTREGKLPPAILSMMESLADAGIEVLPITGRPSGEALGLARYLPRVKHAIAENGATYIIPEEPLEFLVPVPNRAKLVALAAELSRDLERPLCLTPDDFCRSVDVAFLRDGRNESELENLRQQAAARGVFLVWSSVHIHLNETAPDKGAAALTLAARLGYQPHEIATIGDAPNDAGLWVAGRFGLPVGTEAVLRYLEVLPHHPAFVVSEAATGWLELGQALLDARR
jgi:hypothetical protein